MYSLMVSLFLMALVAPFAEAQVNANLLLLPIPREVTLVDETAQISEPIRIILGRDFRPADLFAAKELQRHLREKGANAEIDTQRETKPKPGDICLGQGLANLRLNKVLDEHGVKRTIRREGYILIVSKKGIGVWGNDDSGILYGSLALADLLCKKKDFWEARCCVVRDSPAKGFRGVWVQPSRENLPALTNLVMNALPRYRINRLVLQLDDFDSSLKAEASAQTSLTVAELSTLVDLARSRQISVIPATESYLDPTWAKEQSITPTPPHKGRKLTPTEAKPETPFGILSQPEYFAHLLKSYQQIITLLTPGFFHVGFHAPSKAVVKSEEELALQTASITMLLERIHTVLAARSAQTIVFADLFLSSEELLEPTGALTLSISEASARRRSIAKQTSVLDLRWRNEWPIQAGKARPLVTLLEEGYTTIVSSESDTVWNRAQCEYESAYWGDLYRTKALTEDDLAGFLAFAAYTWKGAPLTPAEIARAKEEVSRVGVP